MTKLCKKHNVWWYTDIYNFQLTLIVCILTITPNQYHQMVINSFQNVFPNFIPSWNVMFISLKWVTHDKGLLSPVFQDNFQGYINKTDLN